MNPRDPADSRRAPTRARRAEEADLFLRIIKMGCSDAFLIAITGAHRQLERPLGPDVASATDFLSWYELRLDHMPADRDNRPWNSPRRDFKRIPAGIAWHEL